MLNSLTKVKNIIYLLVNTDTIYDMSQKLNNATLHAFKGTMKTHQIKMEMCTTSIVKLAFHELSTFNDNKKYFLGFLEFYKIGHNIYDLSSNTSSDDDIHLSNFASASRTVKRKLQYKDVYSDDD